MKAGQKVNIGLVITVLVLSVIALVGMFLPYINIPFDENTYTGTLFQVMTDGSYSLEAESTSSIQALVAYFAYGMTEDMNTAVIIAQVFYIITIVGFAILVWNIVMSILMLIPAVRKTFVGTVYKVFTMIFGLISFFVSLVFIAMPVILVIAGGAAEVGFLNIITPAVMMLFVGFFVGFIIQMVAFARVGKEVQ